MKRLLVISVFAILVLTFGAGTAAEPGFMRRCDLE